MLRECIVWSCGRLWRADFNIAICALAGYLAESKQSAITRMTTAKQYDFLNRLRQISSLPATGASPGAVPISFGYQYNDANQRTRATLNDGSYWVYSMTAWAK